MLLGRAPVLQGCRELGQCKRGFRVAMQAFFLDKLRVNFGQREREQALFCESFGWGERKRESEEDKSKEFGGRGVRERER